MGVRYENLKPFAAKGFGTSSEPGGNSIYEKYLCNLPQMKVIYQTENI